MYSSIPLFISEYERVLFPLLHKKYQFRLQDMNLILLMPEKLLSNVRCFGRELDSLKFKIIQHLFGEAICNLF